MKITRLGELYFMKGEVNRKYYETYGATINDCFKMLKDKMGGGKLKQEKEKFDVELKN